MWKIAYFSVWKNRGFLLAVLYWTEAARDSGTAGQLGTTGQWTDGLSSIGQRDTGRAILYWTEAARDSGHGGWTVDGTEWTEPSVQLFTTLSISYCLEVDRRYKKFGNKINKLQRLCPALSWIGNKNRYLHGQVDRAQENTHIYLYNIYSIFPSRPTALHGVYIFLLLSRIK